jgi:hypothetical protein
MAGNGQIDIPASSYSTIRATWCVDEGESRWPVLTEIGAVGFPAHGETRPWRSDEQFAACPCTVLPAKTRRRNLVAWWSSPGRARAPNGNRDLDPWWRRGFRPRRRGSPHSSASRTIWRRRGHHPRAPMNTPPDPALRPNTGESTTVAAVNLRSRARRTWQRVFLHTAPMMVPGRGKMGWAKGHRAWFYKLRWSPTEDQSPRNPRVCYAPPHALDAEFGWEGWIWQHGPTNKWLCKDLGRLATRSHMAASTSDAAWGWCGGREREWAEKGNSVVGRCRWIWSKALLLFLFSFSFSNFSFKFQSSNFYSRF